VLNLTLRTVDPSGYRVLAIGSHADDIEIGCGGTILRLTETYPECDVYWIVLSAEGVRAEEARRSAAAFLENTRTCQVIVRTFRESFFPNVAGDVKEFFEELKDEIAPVLIFTHYRHDLHQDHRIASELTWNTFRDHLILEYEVPKYDGDFSSPNVFVHLSEAISRRKVEKILANFASQHRKSWFTEDLFLATLRVRGMESNSPTRYAEGFYGRKVVL